MLDISVIPFRAVYKISGSPGILTPKIAGGLPDFSNWETATLPCFTLICTSIYDMDAQLPTDFGGLPDLLTWKSAGCPCFFLLIDTLLKD